MKSQKEMLLEEELLKFQSAHSNFTQAQAQVAYSSHQLQLTEDNHKNLMNNYRSAMSDLDNIQTELSDKYDGDFQINISDGEIIRNNASDS